MGRPPDPRTINQFHPFPLESSSRPSLSEDGMMGEAASQGADVDMVRGGGRRGNSIQDHHWFRGGESIRVSGRRFLSFSMVEERILYWNCCGASSGNFFKDMKELMREHIPVLIALLEPKVSGSVVDWGA